MTDYEVEIRVRNGRIKARMKEVGIDSVAQLCRCAGVPMGTLNPIVNMTRAPISQRTGDLLPVVEKMAMALEINPWELFTEQQLTKRVEKNVAFLSMTEPEVRGLMSGLNGRYLTDGGINRKEQVIFTEKMLADLRPRERGVLRAIYWDGLDREEVGAKVGVSKERIRQIEAKALRRIRLAIEKAEQKT